MLNPSRGHLPAARWLGGCTLLGLVLVVLFPDSIQQDGGYHFLFARWAWKHPQLFVGVWARPLFTTVYAIPALISYPAAKVTSVVISAGTAWLTYRIAVDAGLKRPEWSIPLLFVQPSFFVVCADTMTEPIFAFVLAIALRLHLTRRRKAGALAASFLILARPEGFFVGLLWALWLISDRHDRDESWIRRYAPIPLLATGSVLWWLAALLITRDPFFIVNNWPSSWPVTGTIYGSGTWWSYLVRLPEIIGPLLIPMFVIGLGTLMKRKSLVEMTSLFLLFLVLHTILRRFGLLGSAGYPRYFVAISPAVAVITLSGWNWFGESVRTAWLVRRTAMAVLLLASLSVNFAYFDGAEWIRDARAATETLGWFDQTRLPVSRLIWSQAYMCILLDRDPWENVSFTRDRLKDLHSLRDSPPGTLVFWEDRFGPKWHGMTPDDFTAAGYDLLHQQEFLLKGYILPRSFFGFGGPRRQVMYLFYKRKAND